MKLRERKRKKRNWWQWAQTSWSTSLKATQKTKIRSKNRRRLRRIRRKTIRSIKPRHKSKKKTNRMSLKIRTQLRVWPMSKRTMTTRLKLKHSKGDWTRLLTVRTSWSLTMEVTGLKDSEMNWSRLIHLLLLRTSLKTFPNQYLLLLLHNTPRVYTV